MPARFDYTTQARGFTLRYPLLAYTLIQINFWIIAYVLFTTILYFSQRGVALTYNADIPVLFLPGFWSSIIAGIIYGSCLGIIDWRFEKTINRRLSMGLIILLRSLLYFFVLLLLLAFMRYILWERILLVYFYADAGFRFSDEGWNNLFINVGIYSLVMAPAISFINQMNKKFGPGVLIPMLLGKYRNPREQERLFMFMDMQSSTTHAEELGPTKYSSLIQDCYLDINQVLLKYHAEIYQYVGDEIVLSWLRTRGLKGHSCLDFFFECERHFESRKEYYEEKYGIIPKFKAGLHLGMVVAAEVGDIKREIAYHGDAINTSARIQGLCNQYGQRLLVSSEVMEFVGSDFGYNFDSIGELALRGKVTETHLYGVAPISNS